MAGRFRDTGDGPVPYTAEEEAARDAEEAAENARIAEALAALDATAYRRERKAAYVAELGQAPVFDETVGDVLDTLIAQVEAMRLAAAVPRTTAFDAMMTKIGAIKARYPKPKA